MSTFDDTFLPATPSVFSFLGEALRRVFGVPQIPSATQVTDEATLRELRRLDEHHLQDVGACRRPRRMVRLEIGRGMEPVAVFEYDYFRLRV